MTLPSSLHNDMITLKNDKKFKNKYNTINQLNHSMNSKIQDCSREKDIAGLYTYICIQRVSVLGPSLCLSFVL